MRKLAIALMVVAFAAIVACWAAGDVPCCTKASVLEAAVVNAATRIRLSTVQSDHTRQAERQLLRALELAGLRCEWGGQRYACE